MICWMVKAPPKVKPFGWDWLGLEVPSMDDLPESTGSNGDSGARHETVTMSVEKMSDQKFRILRHEIARGESCADFHHFNGELEVLLIFRRALSCAMVKLERGLYGAWSPHHHE